MLHFDKLLLLIALTTALMSAAQAQAKTGWGFSAGIGGSHMSDEDGSEKFDGNAFGFSLEGEYRFTPNFAFGLGGFSLGEASDTFNSVETDLKVRGFGAFARLIYPMSDTVDLYGRLGAVHYFADLNPGGGLSGLFGDDAVELGLGADIGSGENLSVRIEGRYFNGSSDETGALVTVGFSYRF